MIIDCPRSTDLPGLRRLWMQAFGDSSALLDNFYRVGFSFDRCRCIREGEEIVAALYWFDCHWGSKKVAYIYAVATDVFYRGKGLCHQLMADTHRQLQEQGYSGAVLVPADDGLVSLYAKLGYRCFCTVDEMSTAGKNIQAATEITPAEYAGLRKSFLGENAIFQDVTVFDYLATYGGFYKTPGGICCGYWENDTFHLEELLGENIPCQATSLQAMYLSLDKDSQLPGYFAIPLN